MNKIVRDHYPVSSLPDDLKTGLDEASLVRVVIEESAGDPNRSREAPWSGYPADEEASRPVKDIKDVLDSIRAHKATLTSSVTEEEAVRRIRELRDEWDDE